MWLSKISAYARLMRFHKPIGILLFIWPSLWALWIAGRGAPHLKNIIIFIVGAIVMRAAGCVINDIADRNFDKFVQRTARRPLAAGEVSLWEALILFLILLSMAAILAFQLNLLAILLAFMTVGLACLYPFTKRWISCPQLFLGVTIAGSVPMAFAVEINKITVVCGLIYGVTILWALIYDTEYAMADRLEDLKIGLKSTAILFGKYDILMIILMQILMLIFLIILGTLLKLNIIYFLSVFIIFLLFIYQIFLIKERNAEQCFKAFMNNPWIGAVLFLGIVFSNINL